MSIPLYFGLRLVKEDNTRKGAVAVFKEVIETCGHSHGNPEKKVILCIIIFPKKDLGALLIPLLGWQKSHHNELFPASV